MCRSRKIGSFVRTFLRGSRLERELSEEVEGALAELIARKIRSGLAPHEARRYALIELGGIEQVKEDARHARVGYGVEMTLRDIRYGWRSLWRSPGFALVVILTLALGIGANVTMFSVARSVLWRALPYPDADRIVLVTVDARGVSNAGAAAGELLDIREQSRFIDHVCTIAGVEAHLNIDGEVELVAAASVTDDVLPLFGAVPLALGRTLRTTEDYSAGLMRIVISHDLWRRRFGGDPTIVGRRVQVNNKDMQVVGVLGSGLRMFLPPSAGAAEQIDVWFPLTAEDLGSSREYRGLPILGRLAPGATLRQAQAELDVLAARFVRDHPDAYPDGALRLSVTPLRDALTEDARPALLALAAAVGFVLLVACVNVANVTLARNKNRENELAIRRALGAAKIRLVRQLFTESLLLTALGGGTGLLAGYLGLQLVDWLRPIHLPRQAEISVDGTVVVYAVALSVATSLAFGLLPALRLASDRQPHALRAARSGTSAPATRRLQRALVIAEVALSIVPLVAAGLMLRTFVHLVGAPIGFDPSNLLTANTSISLRELPDASRRWAFYREVMDRVRQVPDVEGVSAASPLPFASSTRRYGREGDEETPLSLGTYQSVMPRYLGLAQITLRAGRDFAVEDIDAERPVVIIDQRIARQLWPGGALGKRLVVEAGPRRQALEVIGVTNAVRMTDIRDEATPHFFVPYHVHPIEMSLLVQTRQSAEAIGPAIKRTIDALGTGRAVSDIRPMSDRIADSMSDTRFTMFVLVGFASAALLLAGIGLYGTLAYLTSQRTRELGVRMALGASVGQIMAMIVREGIALTAVGAGIGLLGALAITGTIRGLLYHVKPFDSVTVLLVSALVVAVAMLAASRPAWRAARIDPNLALRSE
ncbi:MAG: FtsX-like permease family protein [Luteitalea sp.]|nr:FtsX-like permease family protein [Luteitalea sp.]